MTNIYNESILVCVYYGPNGERLIKRGCNIAKMLKAPLYILTVDEKPFDELDAEKVFYIEQWKKIADEHKDAHFIMKDNEKRPVSKVIAEVARKKCDSNHSWTNCTKSLATNHKRFYNQ